MAPDGIPPEDTTTSPQPIPPDVVIKLASAIDWREDELLTFLKKTK